MGVSSDGKGAELTIDCLANPPPKRRGGCIDRPLESLGPTRHRFANAGHTDVPKRISFVRAAGPTERS